MSNQQVLWSTGVTVRDWSPVSGIFSPPLTREEVKEQARLAKIEAVKGVGSIALFAFGFTAIFLVLALFKPDMLIPFMISFLVAFVTGSR
jgi:hypothetical protein